MSHAIERARKAIQRHGFQQIIGGGDPERIDREIREGRDEDHQRPARFAQPSREIEPAWAGHVDIEQDQIRMRLSGERQRRMHVPGLAHHFRLPDRPQHRGEPSPRGGLVIDDQDTQRHAGTGGRRSSATNRAAVSRVASVAASPNRTASL
nr:hypothetical protein [Sphingomonas sp.]